MIKEGSVIILLLFITFFLPLTLVSAKLDFSNPLFPKLTKDQASSILFSQITGTDYNGCTGTNKVTNVSFVNGDLQIVCATDEIGAGGTGDITSVQGDIYITNGADAGAVNLIFNETKLNQTIDSRSVTIESDPRLSSNLTNGFSSNVIPLSNFTYNLGNQTRYWNNLFVKNITIPSSDFSRIQSDGKFIGSPATIDFANDDLIFSVNGSASVSFIIPYMQLERGQAGVIPYQFSPQQDLGFNLGDPSTKWDNTYTNNLFVTTNATASWFNGLFNWTTDNFFIFNGANLQMNTTQLNNTISNLGVNIGFNSTFNSTYNSFAYNQTISAINDINSRFWNISQSWNRTQLYNITEINSFNASWTSIFNSTYDAKISFDKINIAYLNETLPFTRNQTINANLNITGTIYMNQNNLNISQNTTCIIISGSTSKSFFC